MVYQKITKTMKIESKSPTTNSSRDHNSSTSPSLLQMDNFNAITSEGFYQQNNYVVENLALDLSKSSNNNNNKLPIKRNRSPSPTHSIASSFSSSIHQYPTTYEATTINAAMLNSGYYKHDNNISPQFTYNPFGFNEILPSAGALFAMYCRSIRENRFTDIPHIRDFIETIIDPQQINADQIDKLVDQIKSTYSLPPSLPDQKIQRPFKGLPRDPDQIPARFAACDLLKPNPFQQVEGFMEYRKQALEKIRNTNGGFRTMSNPKMRRINNGRCPPVGSDTTTTTTTSIDGGCRGQTSDDNRSDNGDLLIDTTEQNRDNDISSIGSSENNNESKMEINDSDSIYNNNNNNNKSFVTPNGGVIKDAAYFERRRKNNAAAKKSRDRRRLKEDELTIRNEFLEKQSIELHSKLDTLALELKSVKSREVQLLCDRKAFETRENELRRDFETREAELLDQLRAAESRANDLIHQNESLKAQNNSMFYRLQALESRGSRLHNIQSVH